MKTREDARNALIKASTHPDGTLGMDLEEIDEMVDLIMEDSAFDVKSGYVTIKGKQKVENIPHSL